MPGFANIQQLVDAELNGQVRYSTWRKSPTQTTAAGIWFDLSMSPGNPKPNFYASTPNIADRLSLSTDGGIYHGGAVSPALKFVKQITALTVTATAVPLQLILCDYLLYYPFIDMSITDPQPMDNTITLSRYTTGAGVKMMAVVVGAQAGGGQFNVTYTNQDGVQGRVTPNVTCSTQSVTGTIVTTATATAGCAGPFIPLQGTDTGVRKVEGVTFLSADVGLITLVLVQPITNMTIRGTDAPVERNYPVDFTSMEPIVDNAYLNFICCPGGSTLAGAAIHGDATFVWG